MKKLGVVTIVFLLVLWSVGCSDVQLSASRRAWVERHLDLQKELLSRAKNAPDFVCGGCVVGSLTEEDVVSLTENNITTFQIILDADAERTTEDKKDGDR